MAILRLRRDEFLSEYWEYRAGEHVSLIAPTQRGKTHLAYQLLQAAMEQNPGLRTVSLMPKPRDPATTKWAAALNLRETPVWPPHKKWLSEKPAGYVLWPRHRRDLPPEDNKELVAAELKKCLHQQYWDGNSITFGDDVYITAVLMRLNPEYEQFWVAGSAGGAGLWTANQKPSGTIGGGAVSSFSYNSPSHLFLGQDSDLRNQKRFAEIGGVDPRQIEYLVRNLKLYSIGGKTVSEQLYVDKRGPYLCSVLPF